MPPRIPFLVASGFGSGLVPKGSGTAGSALALLIWWTSSWLLPLHSGLPLAFALLSLFAGLAATHLCLEGMDVAGEIAARGKVDPSFVVIDEWCGMFISLIGTAWNEPYRAICAFVLFRLFDIIKPWPIKRVERLPGAWGIMLDDVLAGIASVLLTSLLCSRLP